MIYSCREEKLELLSSPFQEEKPSEVLLSFASPSLRLCWHLRHHSRVDTTEDDHRLLSFCQ